MPGDPTHVLSHERARARAPTRRTTKNSHCSSSGQSGELGNISSAVIVRHVESGTAAKLHNTRALHTQKNQQKKNASPKKRGTCHAV